MSDPVRVTVFPDGPYQVQDAGSVSFCGQPLPADGTLYICRCGGSARPPFCDGTHGRNGFQGQSPARPQKEVAQWQGRRIRTFYNPNACMHVFYCKPLTELRAREEVGDPDAAAEIARVVATCPSGALSYEADDSVPAPDLGERPAIDIMEGGELRLQAPFEINAPLQERQTDTRATLCRCGLSASKPWCDGRHKGRRDFR